MAPLGRSVYRTLLRHARKSDADPLLRVLNADVQARARTPFLFPAYKTESTEPKAVGWIKKGFRDPAKAPPGQDGKALSPLTNAFDVMRYSGACTAWAKQQRATPESGVEGLQLIPCPFPVPGSLLISHPLHPMNESKSYHEKFWAHTVILVYEVNEDTTVNGVILNSTKTSQVQRDYNLECGGPVKMGHGVLCLSTEQVQQEGRDAMRWLPRDSSTFREFLLAAAQQHGEPREMIDELSDLSWRDTPFATKLAEQNATIAGQGDGVWWGKVDPKAAKFSPSARKRFFSTTSAWVHSQLATEIKTGSWMVAYPVAGLDKLIFNQNTAEADADATARQKIPATELLWRRVLGSLPGDWAHLSRVDKSFDLWPKGGVDLYRDLVLKKTPQNIIDDQTFEEALEADLEGVLEVIFSAEDDDNHPGDDNGDDDGDDKGKGK